MGKSDNEEPREVSVSFQMDETGFSAKTKSLIVNAFERLAAGLLIWPATWLEGRAERLQDVNETRSALAAVDREAAVELAQRHHATGRRTFEIFLSEQNRKQENKDAVVMEAAEELRALPPPTGAHEAENRPDRLNDDWLSVFGSHAENASGEHMRKLWARVLAGEIRQPGSFSRTTLRILSELDQDIAMVFEIAMSFCIEDEFIPLPRAISHLELDSLTFLEDIGLVNGAAGALQRVMQVSDDGAIHLENRQCGLRIHLRHGLTSIAIDAAFLTRAGQEIAGLIVLENEERALRRLAEILMSGDHGVGRIELTKVARSSSGQASSEVVEVLFER